MKSRVLKKIHSLVAIALVLAQLRLARFIATPDQLLAEGDPLATALFAQYQ